MKKIKIAQVITRLDWGGSTEILRTICCNLDKEIYDLKLIIGLTNYPSAKTKEFLREFNDRVTVIPQLRRDINPLNDLLALIRLYLIFRSGKFDVVHTHTAKAGVLGRLAARLYGGSIIVHTPHGHNFYGYFGPTLSKIIIAIEKFLSSFTDKIIALTELEQKDLLRFKITGADRIVLIRQGLELDRYMQANIDKDKIKKELNIQPHENVLGMIGRLEPVKGPLYFVEAAKDIIEEFPETKFLIVGEGILRKRLERRIEILGLKEKFIFTGWREDMPEIISVLDLLIFPSLNEAVGMVLIEAQACGVPVVATEVGGIPEIVNNNRTGILVPAGDSKELARAVNCLLGDKQKRSQLSKEAQDWIKDKFKVQEMIDKLSELYKELISKKYLPRAALNFRFRKV